MALATIKGGNRTIVIRTAADGGQGVATYILSDVSDGLVGTYAIHFVSSTFVGSVTVQGRSRLISDADAAPAFLPIPYLALNTGGSVGTYATGANAAITGTGIIHVPASGLTVALDATVVTSGTLTCYVVPIHGAAA